MLTNVRRFLHLHKNWKVRQTFNLFLNFCLLVCCLFTKVFSERGRFSKKHAQITTNNTKQNFFSLSGLFKESRHVDCADSEGNANDPELCDDSKKPEAVRECESENEEVSNIWKLWRLLKFFDFDFTGLREFLGCYTMECLFIKMPECDWNSNENGLLCQQRWKFNNYFIRGWIFVCWRTKVSIRFLTAFRRNFIDRKISSNQCVKKYSVRTYKRWFDGKMLNLS